MIAAFITILLATTTLFAGSLDEARQMVLVVTPDWQNLSAQLAYFERGTNNGEWGQVKRTFPVVVGRNGLGWGTGLHTTNDLSGPIKREGDGKSPAGIFRLSGAFGYAEPSSAKWIRLPYVQCTASLECVDDSKSQYYNSTLERQSVSKADWHSSEDMRRKDELYRQGIFIDHNKNPTLPDGGSCIFVHIWQGPAIGTSGCTAMTSERLEELLKWLDAAKQPVLVQLPKVEYARLQANWHLPVIDEK
jgi:L,D-peptidoglycan transpeptidase YkuD (ErfK/YbiS/YcfS/YnhG family)